MKNVLWFVGLGIVVFCFFLYKELGRWQQNDKDWGDPDKQI